MDRLLTSEDIADVLRVEVVTVRRLVTRGELAAYRIGGEYRFTEGDLADYLRRQRVAAVASDGDAARPSPLAHLLRKVAPAGHVPPWTDEARTVLEAAYTEAERLGAPLIGTDHLLAGLVDAPGNSAVAVLGRLLQMEPAAVGTRVVDAIPRAAAAQPVQHHDRTPARGSTLSLAAEKALHLGVEEAQRLKHPTVGPHHLLLGLVREGDGTAAQALSRLGVTLAAAREQVQHLAPEEPLAP